MKLALPIALCLAGIAEAQIPRHRFLPPDGTAGVFSRAAAFAGDVDGDGTTDVVIGDLSGDSGSRALVNSGRTGALLFTLTGKKGEFGRSVAAAGDVDGDGHADVVVGAPRQLVKGVRTGLAWVYSGSTGKVLYKYPGTKAFGLAGYAVAGLDANLDGFSDVVVGMPGESRVEVRSGFDGSLLWSATKYGGGFGSIVAPAGDVDADGTEDLLVAQGTLWYNAGYSGKAYVFSGATGAQLHKFETASSYDGFAFALCSAGDVDGDGHADVAVGARGHDLPFEQTVGRVDVYSGLTGARLLVIEGVEESEELGTALAPAGDWDRDGHDDLFVTSKRPGGTGVYSGLDGSQLFAVMPVSSSIYWVADAGGNLDGDGDPDLLLADANWPGGVWTYLNRSPLGTPTCEAVSNSTGIAGLLYAEGSAQVAANDLQLRAAYLPPGTFGYLLASRTPDVVHQPGGSQGILCLGGEVARWSQQPLIADAGGATLQEIDLTSIPTTPPQAVQPGETWIFQVWHRDLNPDPTSNFTLATSVVFQ